MRRPKDPDARTNVLARYLVGEAGIHDTDAFGRRIVLSPDMAFVSAGAGYIAGNKTVGQLLTETKQEYPNRVPAVVRTVGPEIEQSQITMRLADWVALMQRGSK